ncbi:MAG: hypothetical protein H6700_01055 [Myxococcales bacterium]|nr:hypothetical protein [Myxococcales bacterium]
MDRFSVSGSGGMLDSELPLGCAVPPAVVGAAGEPAGARTRTLATDAGSTTASSPDGS